MGPSERCSAGPMWRKGHGGGRYSMQIINDRSITVSTGTGRKCTNWQPAVMTLGELYDRLHTPIRGEETLAAYICR